jgi:hypothetical protein
VFGVITGIIGIAYTLLLNYVVSGMLGNILAVLFFLVLIALNLLAGVRASQWTGRVGTGAKAGLITELIASLLGALLTLTKLFVPGTLLHQMFSNTTVWQALQFITLSGIGFAVSLLLGAVIGAIGGLMGRNRAQLPLHV